MARIELTDVEWKALSTLTTLDDGSTYYLQARSDEDLKHPADIILTVADAEPSTLTDGLIGHDFKFKYAGAAVYVRATGLPCTLKCEVCE